MGADAGGGAVGVDFVARSLRESRAERFFAIVDGEAREVKAAKTRGRWERLAQAAIMLGAQRIEARDADGATLAVVQLADLDDEPAPSPQLALPLVEPRRADTIGEVERLTALVMRSVDQALLRHGEQSRAIVDAALGVMQASAERAGSMERAVLALVQQRERELDAVAASLASERDQLAAEARAAARAAARATPEKDEDAEAFDAMGRKLIEDHVMPVVGAKLAAKLTGGSTPGGTA